MSFNIPIIKKKKLIVFSKNKLVSMDAIIPLLIEMKEIYRIQSDIVIFDQLAYESIKENIVIKDALQYIGRDLYITKGANNKILRRVYAAYYLLFIIYDAFRGAKLIHFGVLDQWPLKALGYTFKNNVYHMQSNGYNFDKFQYKSTKPIEYKLVGRNLVSFGSKYIKGRLLSEHKVKKVFNFGPPKKRSNWIQYIYNKSDYYFNKYHNNIDVSCGIIVIIMSSLDKYTPTLRDSYKTQAELFIKTLNVLSKFDNKIPIFIKPHIYTNLALLDSLIVGNDNITITYLHPSVLATKSRVFISNQFSNTLADAHSLGVTTIEYTDYPERILKETKGRSVSYKFVDHFINNDMNHFESIITEILNKDFTLSYNQKGVVNDKSGLLSHLAT
jgi:hypothetical protein